MLERRMLLGATTGSVLLRPAAFARDVEPAAQRLNELGPENEIMARRAGPWDLTETVWERPGATPIVTRGPVAGRRMIGTMFQEILRLAKASVEGQGQPDRRSVVSVPPRLMAGSLGHTGCGRSPSERALFRQP